MEPRSEPDAGGQSSNDDEMSHAEDGALGALYAARAYIDGLIEEAEREDETLRAGRSHDGGSTE